MEEPRTGVNPARLRRLQGMENQDTENRDGARPALTAGKSPDNTRFLTDSRGAQA